MNAVIDARAALRLIGADDHALVVKTSRSLNCGSPRPALMIGHCRSNRQQMAYSHHENVAIDQYVNASVGEM
jgi:hypothetical protein